jgi:hypothetical protein
MAEPELSCEQMEVQVGRLSMRVEHEIEGAVPLGAIRGPRPSTIGAPRGINGRDARYFIRRPKGSCRVRPAWPNPPYPRLNTNTLAVSGTDARCPHPPHRSARQAQA